MHFALTCILRFACSWNRKLARAISRSKSSIYVVFCCFLFWFDFVLIKFIWIVSASFFDFIGLSGERKILRGVIWGWKYNGSAAKGGFMRGMELQHWRSEMRAATHWVFSYELDERSESILSPLEILFHCALWVGIYYSFACTKGLPSTNFFWPNVLDFCHSKSYPTIMVLILFFSDFGSPPEIKPFFCAFGPSWLFMESNGHILYLFWKIWNRWFPLVKKLKLLINYFLIWFWYLFLFIQILGKMLKFQLEIGEIKNFTLFTGI